MIIDERVLADLAVETRFSDVRLLEVCDSTNRVASQLAAAGHPEGLVVSAEHQTAGRGRLDRTWDSDRGGGLLVSVLLRPVLLAPARWHLLTAAAGLAARDACEQTAGVSPDLKWPNDLMLGDRKLAGILAESTSGAVVVGMGLNVHSAPPGSAHLDEAAGRPVDRGGLLVTWLRSFDAMLGPPEAPSWDAVADRYRAECATVGRQVAVEQPGGRFTGLASAIDGDGRLVVIPDADDGPVTVSAGDVVHVRPAGGNG